MNDNSYQQKLERNTRSGFIVLIVVLTAGLCLMTVFALFYQVGQKAELPPVQARTVVSHVITTMQVYPTPTPEGWDGWTSYSLVTKGQRLEGGFHWTFANVDSFYRAMGLLPERTVAK